MVTYHQGVEEPHQILGWGRGMLEKLTEQDSCSNWMQKSESRGLVRKKILKKLIAFGQG